MAANTTYPSLTGAGDRATLAPAVLLALIVAAMALCNLYASTETALLVLSAPVGFLLIAQRPDLGVLIILSSLLVTYPSWLQGAGALTLNNGIAAILAGLIGYRVYQDRDFEFLRNRELQLLAAIGVVYYLASYFNTPDEHTMGLVGPFLEREQEPSRIFINRFIFLLFFVTFIRTPSQFRAAFVLAVALMVMTGLAGIWTVLTGGGAAGYRARSGLFISQAANPNRMALFAIIGIISLWYLLQWRRRAANYLWIVPLFPALVLSVFMTGSRSGVAGLALGSGTMFLQGGVSARKIVLGMLMGLVAAVVVVQLAPERSFERATATGASAGEGSLERRTYGVGVALDLARESPMIGVGIGNWDITRYLGDPSHRTTPPHSAYLLALVEGGIVVLGLYFVLLGRTFKNFMEAEWAARASRAKPLSDLLWIASSLRTGFMVFLMFSLVGDLWLHVSFYWFVGLSSVLPRIVAEAQAMPVASEA